MRKWWYNVFTMLGKRVRKKNPMNTGNSDNAWSTLVTSSLEKNGLKVRFLKFQQTTELTSWWMNAECLFISNELILPVTSLVIYVRISKTNPLFCSLPVNKIYWEISWQNVRSYAYLRCEMWSVVDPPPTSSGKNYSIVGARQNVCVDEG